MLTWIKAQGMGAGAQEAVVANLGRELETVHRECRSMQRMWLTKQGDLVAAQVRHVPLPAAHCRSEQSKLKLSGHGLFAACRQQMLCVSPHHCFDLHGQRHPLPACAVTKARACCRCH